jgi:POT family proton-dependent oligopeptide transporter
MQKRTPFPGVFWAANCIEIFERFAYYGIYIPFGIYVQHLDISKGRLGLIQSLFLMLSYFVPVVSGTFADRFGFKKVLIVSYLAYLPSILLLIYTHTFNGIALSMLSIGLAAGIFKPLISGTVRLATDTSNKTLGFGIFYAMVNVGATVGPIVAGRLRAVSWQNAFTADAVAILLMLLFTIFFYKEPLQKAEGITLGRKMREMAIALSDWKFAIFLLLLGLFFWFPYWSFLNLMPLYVDSNLDTARLCENLRSVFGVTIADFFSHIGDDGKRRVLGETIGQTSYFIILLQVFVSRITERYRAFRMFLSGFFLAACGLLIAGLARTAAPALIFPAIGLFAIGEMTASPRIQEYITWIAPKEKAGLYMGSNFLATGVGGLLSGLYTVWYGRFTDSGHPEYVWYALSVHFLLAVLALWIFTRGLGEFREMET